jgi:uncharacterized protein (DUF58 family)
MSMKVTFAPTKRLFVFLSLLGVLALGCFLWDEVGLIWLTLMSILMVGVVSDAVLLGRSVMSLQKMRWDRQPTVQRPFTLTLEMKAICASLTRFSVEAIESDLLVPSKRNAHVEVLSSGKVLAVMELFPRRRGELRWPGANVQYRTVFNLVEKCQRLDSAWIPVYPKLTRDLQSQFNPELLMQQMGMKINRYRRADQDFESLRPYVIGDNYRHIDWKASARMRSWITRQFQVEHHHNILVCLDSSRLMGTLTEGISKLDWAIEASLHLAYLASRFGDRMGLLVFSNEIDRWVKPLNHPVEAFLSSIYNLECKVVEADFQKVCLSIMAAQKKRSLVIFLSDFLDASSLEPHLNAFGYLNRRHCSLFIGIEDPAYRNHLENFDAETVNAVAQKIVAQDSMKRRQAVLQQLQKMGLKSLTVNPENLVQRAMQAYMEIKLQGAI